MKERIEIPEPHTFVLCRISRVVARNPAECYHAALHSMVMFELSTGRPSSVRDASVKRRYAASLYATYSQSSCAGRCARGTLQEGL
jgi:hypothetical protein